MEKLANISEILGNKNYKPEIGDYVLVSTLWTSGKIATKRKIPLCKYIFVDNEGKHISGVLFSYDHNAHNVHQKLQKKSCWFKIKNFTVHTVEEDDWCDIRGQNRQIKISNSTLNIEECESESVLHQHLPFVFTKLEDVDQCPVNSIIDVIGYATELSKKQKSKIHEIDYKTVTIGSTASSKSGNQVLRKVALFDNAMKAVTRKNEVYAMLNVKVGEFGKDGATNMTLQATARTIIQKVQKDELYKLPPHYLQDPLVQDLFPEKRSKTVTPKKSEISSKALRMPTRTQILREAIDPPYSPGHPDIEYSSDPAVSTSDLKEDEELSNAINMMSVSRKRKSGDQKTEITTMKRFFRDSSPLLDASNTRSSCNQNQDKNFVKVYDFRQNIEPLKVAVKAATEYMDVDKEESYSMRSDPRGVALIINNQFSNDKEMIREGSKQDENYLKELFNQLKFELVVENDVTAKDLPVILDNFKKKFTTEMSACFVAVLSHGVNGYVEMADKKLVPLYTDIVHRFDKFAFPEMAGKPKVFLVQACQDNPTEGHIARSFPGSPEREEVDLENMLVCCAATPGRFAGRDKYLGSHFVYVFADTVMEYAHNTDFLTIFKLVEKCIKKVQRNGSGSLSCCVTPHEFDKKLYLNPGL